MNPFFSYGGRKKSRKAVIAVGSFVIYDGIVKRLNMEHRYRVLLLLIVRCDTSTCTSISLSTSPDELYEFRYVFSERNLNFVIRRGDLSEKNLNINSRGVYVSPFALADISRRAYSSLSLLSRHYLFKCNIGKAFRDEGDYALSQPLKP